HFNDVSVTVNSVATLWNELDQRSVSLNDFLTENERKIDIVESSPILVKDLLKESLLNLEAREEDLTLLDSALQDLILCCGPQEAGSASLDKFKKRYNDQKHQLTKLLNQCDEFHHLNQSLADTNDKIINLSQKIEEIKNIDNPGLKRRDLGRILDYLNHLNSKFDHASTAISSKFGNLEPQVVKAGQAEKLADELTLEIAKIDVRLEEMKQAKDEERSHLLKLTNDLRNFVASIGDSCKENEIENLNLGQKIEKLTTAQKDIIESIENYEYLNRNAKDGKVKIPGLHKNLRKVQKDIEKQLVAYKGVAEKLIEKADRRLGKARVDVEILLKNANDEHLHEIPLLKDKEQYILDSSTRINELKTEIDDILVDFNKNGLKIPYEEKKLREYERSLSNLAEFFKKWVDIVDKEKVRKSLDPVQIIKEPLMIEPSVEVRENSKDLIPEEPEKPERPSRKRKKDEDAKTSLFGEKYDKIQDSLNAETSSSISMVGSLEDHNSRHEKTTIEFQMKPVSLNAPATAELEQELLAFDEWTIRVEKLLDGIEDIHGDRSTFENASLDMKLLEERFVAGQSFLTNSSIDYAEPNKRSQLVQKFERCRNRFKEISVTIDSVATLWNEFDQRSSLFNQYLMENNEKINSLESSPNLNENSIQDVLNDIETKNDELQLLELVIRDLESCCGPQEPQSKLMRHLKSTLENQRHNTDFKSQEFNRILDDLNQLSRKFDDTTSLISTKFPNFRSKIIKCDLVDQITNEINGEIAKINAKLLEIKQAKEQEKSALLKLVSDLHGSIDQIDISCKDDVLENSNLGQKIQKLSLAQKDLQQLSENFEYLDKKAKDAKIKIPYLRKNILKIQKEVERKLTTTQTLVKKFNEKADDRFNKLKVDIGKLNDQSKNEYLHELPLLKDKESQIAKCLTNINKYKTEFNDIVSDFTKNGVEIVEKGEKICNLEQSLTNLDNFYENWSQILEKEKLRRSVEAEESKFVMEGCKLKTQVELPERVVQKVGAGIPETRKSEESSLEYERMEKISSLRVEMDSLLSETSGIEPASETAIVPELNSIIRDFSTPLQEVLNTEAFEENPLDSWLNKVNGLLDSAEMTKGGRSKCEESLAKLKIIQNEMSGNGQSLLQKLKESNVNSKAGTVYKQKFDALNDRFNEISISTNSVNTLWHEFEDRAGLFDEFLAENKQKLKIIRESYSPCSCEDVQTIYKPIEDAEAEFQLLLSTVEDLTICCGPQDDLEKITSDYRMKYNDLINEMKSYLHKRQKVQHSIAQFNELNNNFDTISFKLNVAKNLLPLELKLATLRDLFSEVSSLETKFHHLHENFVEKFESPPPVKNFDPQLAKSVNDEIAKCEKTLADQKLEKVKLKEQLSEQIAFLNDQVDRLTAEISDDQLESATLGRKIEKLQDNRDLANKIAFEFDNLQHVDAKDYKISKTLPKLKSDIERQLSKYQTLKQQVEEKLQKRFSYLQKMLYLGESNLSDHILLEIPILDDKSSHINNVIMQIKRLRNDLNEIGNELAANDLKLDNFDDYGIDSSNRLAKLETYAQELLEKVENDKISRQKLKQKHELEMSEKLIEIDQTIRNLKDRVEDENIIEKSMEEKIVYLNRLNDAIEQNMQTLSEIKHNVISQDLNPKFEDQAINMMNNLNFISIEVRGLKNDVQLQQNQTQRKPFEDHPTTSEIGDDGVSQIENNVQEATVIANVEIVQDQAEKASKYEGEKAMLTQEIRNFEDRLLFVSFVPKLSEKIQLLRVRKYF
uniref:KASH domain-containing protein n=1 Tax=Romanomermis culicivorax TaxID=13658 RepID=A0A915ICG2_ROMCU